MRIVMITGSPHKNGTSALLARRFEEGAREAGHEPFRFDAAFESVHSCIGCDKCGWGAKPCVFRDAVDALYPKLREADLIAFVTPLYYHGPSAQLKAVVDRFHGIDNFLRGADKKAVLIATAADSDVHVTRGLEAEYEGNAALSEMARRGAASCVGMLLSRRYRKNRLSPKSL